LKEGKKSFKEKIQEKFFEKKGKTNLNQKQSFKSSYSNKAKENK
jgi:hypothetical protein